jgi:hypothetical protein
MVQLSTTNTNPLTPTCVKYPSDHYCDIDIEEANKGIDPLFVYAAACLTRCNDEQMQQLFEEEYLYNDDTVHNIAASPYGGLVIVTATT